MADTGWKTSVTLETAGGWDAFNLTLLNTIDTQYCTETANAYPAGAEVSDFAFGIPAGSTINGIECQTVFSSSNGIRTAYVRLSHSWNDGTNYTATQEQSVLGTTDTTKTYGGAADTWGRSWTSAEFAAGTFRTKIEGYISGGIAAFCRLDYFQIKVYYTTSQIDSVGGLTWSSQVSEIGGLAKASISQVGGLNA